MPIFLLQAHFDIDLLRTPVLYLDLQRIGAAALSASFCIEGHTASGILSKERSRYAESQDKEDGKSFQHGSSFPGVSRLAVVITQSGPIYLISCTRGSFIIVSYRYENAYDDVELHRTSGSPF